jgi:hypothetical protein
MSGYADATVGNVNHMGSYVALVVPPLVLAVISHARTWLGRIGLLLVVLLGLVNLIVSGSRTAMVVTLFALGLTALSFGLRRASVGVLVLFVVSLMVFTYVGDSVN